MKRYYETCLAFVSPCPGFGFLEWKSLSSPFLCTSWQHRKRKSLVTCACSDDWELEAIMFFSPDASRYKRQKFYFCTFIFWKNVQIHTCSMWIYMHMLFVTFRIVRIFCSSAYEKIWRWSEGTFLMFGILGNPYWQCLYLCLNIAILRTFKLVASFFCGGYIFLFPLVYV